MERYHKLFRNIVIILKDPPTCSSHPNADSFIDKKFLEDFDKETIKRLSLSDMRDILYEMLSCCGHKQVYRINAIIRKIEKDLESTAPGSAYHELLKKHIELEEIHDKIISAITMIDID